MIKPVVGDDRPALFARVTFTASASDPGVPLGANGRYMLPADAPWLTVETASVDLVDVQAAPPLVGPMPASELWPVMYDFDNSGRVDLADLSLFAAAFGQPVGGGAPGTDWTWASDFDRSGIVDLADLSFFAPNFQRAVADGQPRRYPENFPGDWRGQPLRVEAETVPAGSVPQLMEAQLASVFDSAIARLEATAGRGAAVTLGEVAFSIVDLSGNQLGRALPGKHIEIDIDAAGYGWFIDGTSWDDVEFGFVKDSRDLMALPGGDAVRRVDLRTVIMHELGHVLGYDHSDHGVMDESLPLGTRRVWDVESLLDDTPELDAEFDTPALTPATVDEYFATTLGSIADREFR